MKVSTRARYGLRAVIAIARMGKTGRAVGFALYLDRLEEYFMPRDAYDADVVLLYDAKTPPQKVADAAAELGKNGDAVTALPALPQKLKARRVVKLDENGVMTC